MPGIPYFGFPNFYRRNYYYNNYYNNQHLRKPSPNNNSGSNISSSNSNFNASVSTNNNTLVENKNKTEHSDRSFNKKNPDNSCLFELFGLKLYFDDILLVSLIYFLYNEGVKDEGLFIALILLLLS